LPHYPRNKTIKHKNELMSEISIAKVLTLINSTLNA